MRRAFTLIEVLVALVILEFTLLAVAATTAVAARNFARAYRAEKAQSLARNRLELLVAGACASPVGGSRVVPGGFEESWQVEVEAALRRLSVSVAYTQTANRRAEVTLASAVWCRS